MVASINGPLHPGRTDLAVMFNARYRKNGHYFGVTAVTAARAEEARETHVPTW